MPNETPWWFKYTGTATKYDLPDRRVVWSDQIEPLIEETVRRERERIKTIIEEKFDSYQHWQTCTDRAHCTDRISDLNVRAALAKILSRLNSVK